jgi:hypothetical protein
MRALIDVFTKFHEEQTCGCVRQIFGNWIAFQTDGVNTAR